MTSSNNSSCNLAYTGSRELDLVVAQLSGEVQEILGHIHALQYSEDMGHRLGASPQTVGGKKHNRTGYLENKIIRSYVTQRVENKNRSNLIFIEKEEATRS